MGVSAAAAIDEDNDNNDVSIDGGGIEGRPRAVRRDVAKRPAWATSVEQRMDADALRDDMKLVISFLIASIHLSLSGPVSASFIVLGSPGSEVNVKFT